MMYTKPVDYRKDGEVVILLGEQVVEFQQREISPGVPNLLFTEYRNARARIIVKNGVRVRILVELDGVIETEHPLAVGQAVCKVDEVQSFLAQLRVEEPTTREPVDPRAEPAEEL